MIGSYQGDENHVRSLRHLAAHPDAPAHQREQAAEQLERIDRIARSTDPAVPAWLDDVLAAAATSMEAATCSECRVAAPLHAFFCSQLALQSPPIPERSEHPYENAAWDRAEAELARDLDREYEPDPDWCWGVAS